MSKKEQAALVAFFNSFALSKRVTTFDQLWDGKALFEVMSKIDGSHFKAAPSRATPSASGSTETWVLKMNTLKRLYRLLLSYPLPSPHPSSLSLSSLSEPPFSTIARTPTSPTSISGLVQISRMCLSVGVWGTGNEKVIEKIQGLGEAHMAELMRSIEEVMATLPAREESSMEGSPVKQPVRDVSPPPTGLRAERDKLIQENDELRSRCEQMIAQITEISSNLEDITAERDEAVARFQRESSVSNTLKSSQIATNEVDSLRSDLAKAEENLAHTEANLEKQLSSVSELTKQVEEFRIKAAEAARLKDQLDEYRHAADKLQKSENVIEKYKKKLEDSAGLRRELKSLEEENAALVNTNATLEADLKKAGSAKTLVDNYRSQIEALESKAADQASQIAELTVQLETTQADLVEKEQAHEKDLEELQLHQEKVKEMELGESPAMNRSGSKGALLDAAGNASLGDELETEDSGSASETKTSLKLRIRALQRQLDEAKTSAKEGHQISALESLLADANKSRDRYQAEYLEAHRNGLRLQANLEQIRSGNSGDNSMTMAAIRQRLDEVIDERDSLLKAKEEESVSREDLERKLKAAQVDLSLVDKDQKEQLEVLRKSIAAETDGAQEQLVKLQEDIITLKEKDRMHLEEIKKLLLEKVDLQSTGISQRERALEREKEFSDIRSSLAGTGISAETQDRILDLHTKNGELVAEVKSLENKLAKAKDFIKNQDSLFRATHAKTGGGDFEEAQKSYESQIAALKAELMKTRQASAAIEQRYKLEQQLMLSAWHELGSRTVRDHIATAGTRRPINRPVATSWLGKQRKHLDDVAFMRS